MFNGGVSLTPDSKWCISGDSWVHLKVFPYTNLASDLGRLQWLDGGISVCVVFLCGCPWVAWLLMWNSKACRANVPRKTVRLYLAFSHLSQCHYLESFLLFCSSWTKARERHASLGGRTVKNLWTCLKASQALRWLMATYCRKGQGRTGWERVKLISE